MPLFAQFDVAPPADGRQSPSALKARRGVGRLLRELGFAVVPELILPSGRRVDLIGVGSDGDIVIVEVKSSVADFRSDTKWPEYKAFCDRLYFATLPEVGDIFPQGEGVILTDGYEAEVLRVAREIRLAPKVRRTLHLRVAQTAARRLHELEDPAPQFTVPH